jgi:hypothetical protein
MEEKHSKPDALEKAKERMKISDFEGNKGESSQQ